MPLPSRASPQRLQPRNLEITWCARSGRIRIHLRPQLAGCPRRPPNHAAEEAAALMRLRDDTPVS